MAENKIRVLFVDDDDNVLNGLKRLLRNQRAAWDMEFVNNGPDALALMQRRPVDVVVSDMKMPVMDGAQLLSEARARHPHAVRIILSGFAERESILRTIGPSHRYLAKPCSHDDLVKAVQQALALHSYIESAEVKAAVSKLSHLPSLPAVHAAIMQEIEAEFASAESLAEKVSADVAISAQLMKLTNSAYFNLPVKATTVKQAIQVLGFDNVRAVALFAGVFEQFRNIRSSLTQVVEDLTRHSVEIGLLASRLAQREKYPAAVADHAFCAGLLAHLGTLLMIANDPDGFATAMAHVESGMTLCEAERSVFGASHAQLGGYLLGLWGFADSVVEAVAFHHEPNAVNKEKFDVLTLVHVVQAFVRDSKCMAGRDEGGSLDMAYLEAAGVAQRLPTWRKFVGDIMREWVI